MFTYNVNDTATQVLAAKKVKENIFVDLLHRVGYGVTEVTELDASSVRMFKQVQTLADARQLNAPVNGGFFNNNKAEVPQIIEYDLDLLDLYDQVYDLPEVQQDMVSISVFENATKNIGGRVSTEINASTLAAQLLAKYNGAKDANSWDGLAVILDADPKYYEALQEASTMLDDGDEANGIQSFPFAERQILFRANYRKKLLSEKGVIMGGSNYAQSMLAKGTVSPEGTKDFGNMYCGEIDNIPCFIVPAAIWNRAGMWVGAQSAFAATQAIVIAAAATDRGISPQGYIKVVPSPDGAGQRLQPKVRWGINVCYPKGIIPVLANATAVPSTTLVKLAPGNKVKCAPVVATPASLTFATSATVVLSTATPGAVIYYTDDGSNPDTSKTLYTGAITVNATKTIKAIAHIEGGIDSAVASFTYTKQA